MPVLLKIASPTLADDEYNLSSEYRYDLPPSQPPPCISCRVYFEDNSPPHNVTFEDNSPPRRHSSAISRSSVSAPRALSLSSQRSRSHISISDDDPVPDAAEVLILKDHNTRLKADIQRLRGQIEAMSYEAVIYFKAMY